VELARAGLWLIFAALAGTAAAVPFVAVRHYREVLQDAYGSAEAEREPEPGAAGGEAPRTGSLSVRSDPENAAVYLDDVFIGRTPLKVRGLSYGRHTVEVKRFPFGSTRRSVQLDREEAELFVELSQLTGELLLVGAPGSAVYVDGERRGQLPMGPIELPVGPHQIEVRGGQWWLKTVEVLERQRLTFDLATSPSSYADGSMVPPGPDWGDERRDPRGQRRSPLVPDEGMATLLVNAQPWGEVIFDGQKMGFSPLLLSNVPAGNHSLEVSRRGYRTERRLVQLRPGERASVNIRLERE
jgi:hypothetical protein